MYLLYQMLGISAIIGSIVCIATMIPLQFFIGKKMSNNAKLTAVSFDGNKVVNTLPRVREIEKERALDLLM